MESVVFMVFGAPRYYHKSHIPYQNHLTRTNMGKQPNICQPRILLQSNPKKKKKKKKKKKT